MAQLTSLSPAPRPSPRSKEGNLDEAQKCYTQAINTLESTKKAERDNNLLAICYSNRATVLLSKDAYDGAHKDCIKSLESDGNYTKVRLGRGGWGWRGVCVGVGGVGGGLGKERGSAAFNSCVDSTRLDSDHPVPPHQAFYRKAKAESGLGQYEDALKTVRTAMKQLGAGTTKAKAMGKEREVKELRKLQNDIMGKIKAKADATVAALTKGAGTKGGADLNKQMQKVSPGERGEGERRGGRVREGERERALALREDERAHVVAEVGAERCLLLSLCSALLCSALLCSDLLCNRTRPDLDANHFPLPSQPQRWRCLHATSG